MLYKDFKEAVKVVGFTSVDEFLKVAEAKKGEDFEQIPAALQAAFILTYRSVLAKYL